MNKSKMDETRDILQRVPANTGTLIEAAHRFASKNSYQNYDEVYQEIVKKKKLTKPLPSRPMTPQEKTKFNQLCDEVDDYLNCHPYSKLAKKQMDDILNSLQYSCRVQKNKG